MHALVAGTSLPAGRSVGQTVSHLEEQPAARNQPQLHTPQEERRSHIHYQDGSRRAAGVSLPCDLPLRDAPKLAQLVQAIGEPSTASTSAYGNGQMPKITSLSAASDRTILLSPPES